jgi:hypothetical protein
MLKIGDTFLQDLGVLQPNKTYDVSTVLKLTRRFPQLGLAENIDQIKEIFFCLQLTLSHQVLTESLSLTSVLMLIRWRSHELDPSGGKSAK